MSWIPIESEELISNRWLGVYKDRVRLPNGLVMDDFYRVRVSSAAAVVALTGSRDIVLKREYRYCYDRELIELPSGVFEPDETDPLMVAKRELREETGYEGGEWEYLGVTIENAAKLTNYIHLFLAKDCKKTGVQRLDSTEEIEVLVLPLSEAVEMVMDNRISCNGAAHGILKVARMMGI